MTDIYFISGHIDISEQDFDIHYKPLINKALEEKAKFFVGDAKGIDTFAQRYLNEYSKTDSSICDRVLVFHMFDKPRNNMGSFKTVGGFKSDEDRDSNMTLNSTKDILYVRSAEESMKLYGKKYRQNRISGTEKNRLRRLKQPQK